jgi:hypothetical protein
MFSASVRISINLQVDFVLFFEYVGRISRLTVQKGEHTIKCAWKKIKKVDRRLGLKVGNLITDEIKAPCVQLQKGDEPRTATENKFQRLIERIRCGDVTCKYVVRLADSTELCTIVTRERMV